MRPGARPRLVVYLDIALDGLVGGWRLSCGRILRSQSCHGPGAIGRSSAPARHRDILLRRRCI